MKTTAFLTWVACCVSSCGLVAINGTFQGLTSYYKTVRKQNPELFVQATDRKVYNNPLFSSKIVIANGLTLSDQLKYMDSAVVYMWQLKCSSRVCFSPELFQQRCKRAGLTLFVVAEYYDSTILSRKFDLEYPITGIDTRYYRTNFTSKYTRKFLHDLTGQVPDDSIKNVLYFFRGKYLGSVYAMISDPLP